MPAGRAAPAGLFPTHPIRRPGSPLRVFSESVNERFRSMVNRPLTITQITGFTPVPFFMVKSVR